MDLNDVLYPIVFRNTTNDFERYVYPVYVMLSPLVLSTASQSRQPQCVPNRLVTHKYGKRALCRWYSLPYCLRRLVLEIFTSERRETGITTTIYVSAGKTRKEKLAAALRNGGWGVQRFSSLSLPLYFLRPSDVCVRSWYLFFAVPSAT